MTSTFSKDHTYHWVPFHQLSLECHEFVVFQCRMLYVIDMNFESGDFRAAGNLLLLECPYGLDLNDLISLVCIPNV